MQTSREGSSAVTNLDAPSVIRVKRDGGVLSDDAIDWVIDGYTHGRVADEQMSALLMAIFLNGMTVAETTRWTAAMVASGERFDFTDLHRPGSSDRPAALVDKHSTGGVGDKITIPLLPVVTACGATVPQASGRGLGHTGGTLDKLESIPGFTGELSKDRIRRQLSEVGGAIFAAGELAPADRKIYALRDITATVDSTPLIASSVMSKKLAEGARALVLDVKVGRGAFLKTEADARELARIMIGLGNSYGVPTRALLTDMNCPLGLTVGNSVEITESLEILAGGGPADVVELTLALAREMLEVAGVDGTDPAETLRDGSAMDRFRALIAAQGGDLSRPLPLGSATETVTASHGGVMGDLDAMGVAMAAWRLGAGRAQPGEPVQLGAGVRIHRKPGEPVASGETLFTLYTETADRLPGALAELDGAWTVDDAAAAPRPLIIDRL
ncbi:thymidine phosphorylase [Mycolicibacterium houstonense]|uniref:thymidine phosphorylase n=1 Tax=Mycolicibacterium houstonense TaxID=146021 RepID=UPI000940177C|nr:thymidine phosphorylase [Mycolicibacterium houstonense]